MPDANALGYNIGNSNPTPSINGAAKLEDIAPPISGAGVVASAPKPTIPEPTKSNMSKSATVEVDKEQETIIGSIRAAARELETQIGEAEQMTQSLDERIEQARREFDAERQRIRDIIDKQIAKGQEQLITVNRQLNERAGRIPDKSPTSIAEAEDRVRKAYWEALADETDARKDLNEFRTKALRVKLDNTRLSRPNDSMGQGKDTESTSDKNKRDLGSQPEIK